MLSQESLCLESDEGLVGVANYALKLLQKPPRLVKSSDVSGSFIIYLAMELFGTNSIPYPYASCFLHYHENLSCVLKILSSEIGTELDHIDPREVLRGSRKALSNLLEIMTAFILHCVEEDLLQFDTNHESSVSQDEMHFEHSPELPRSVGRICVPPTFSKNPLSDSPSLKNEEFGVARTGLLDNKPSLFNKAVPFGDVQWVTAANPDLVSKAYSQSPSSFYPRLPSIVSMQLPISPPTTPKDADAILEIIKYPSPKTTVPSLASSPILRDTQTTGLRCLSSSVPGGGQSQSVSVVLPSVQPNYGLTTALLSDDDSLGANQTQMRHKISSSSSGCGPSPTPTVQNASESSEPPSLSESPPIETSPFITEPLSMSCPKKTTTYISLNESRNSCHSSDKHKSTTTNSFPKWKKRGRDIDAALSFDDLNSILTSSTSPQDAPHERETSSHPSASVLIENTERFTKALNARLDYLRTISSRAHKEAEAVGRLVNAIGLSCSVTPHVVPGSNDGFVGDQKQSNLTQDELQNTLCQILMGVNILLHNQFLDSLSEGKISDVAEKRRKTRHRKNRNRERWQKRNSLSLWSMAHNFSDSDFEDILEEKHNLMADALRHCRDELTSWTDQLHGGLRCPRCNILV